MNANINAFSLCSRELHRLFNVHGDSKSVIIIMGAVLSSLCGHHGDCCMVPSL